MQYTNIPVVISEASQVLDPNTVLMGTLRGITVVTTAGTAVPLSTSDVLLESVTLVGYKDRTTKNAATVWIQYDIAVTGSPGVPIDTGLTQSIRAPINKFLSLNKVYIDAQTSGDGVIWVAHY